MAFEKTSRGTYGPSMPAFVAQISKFMNKMMISRFRRAAASGGKPMGLDPLVLTTVGAKTGKERQTPLACFPDGDGAWLIVASAGGQIGNPAWYYNLAAHPSEVKAVVGGKTVNVTATQLAGEERDAAWQRIIAAQPRYAGYESKTDRVIPVIRLTAS